MDLATIVGLIAGFGLLASAIVTGGSPTAFIDPPSIMIVIGGTFMITMVSFSLKEIIKSQGLIFRAMFYRLDDPRDVATDVLEIAEKGRRDGVLGLQKLLSSFEDMPFLHAGLGMVVDGTTGDDVERIMHRQLSETRARHAKSVGILRKAAEVSPAMGLIGTLVGLVLMLGRLDDPSSIGPAMAVALLTTFYGAVLANMVFSPLAAKLERNSAEESLVNTIYLMGVGSIGRQENPRRLEMLLNTILPPSKRIQYFK